MRSIPVRALWISILILSGAPTAQALSDGTPGQVQVYRLAIRSSATFQKDMDEAKAKPDSPDRLAIDLAGQIEVATVRNEGLATLLWMHVVPKTLKIKRGAVELSADTVKSTAAGLESGLFLKLGADGLVQDSAPGATADGVATKLLQYLASLMQIAHPDKPQSKTWSSLETDTTGVYKASYSILGTEAGLLSFKKTKTGYDSVSFEASASTGAQGKAGGLAGRVKGLFTGSLRPDTLRLVALAGKDMIELRLGDGKRALSTARQQVELSFANERTLSKDEEALYAKQPMPSNGALAAAGAPQPDDQQVAAADLGTATALDLVKKAKSIDEKEGSARIDAELELLTKIRAFAILHPDDLEPFAKAIAGMKQSDALFRATLMGIASVGCPQCQAFVRRQAEASAKGRDWETAVFLMPQLAQTPNIDQESEDLIRRLRADGFDEIRSSANLIMGMAASRLRWTAPKRADAIVSEYAKQLEEGKTAAARVDALEVLGNSASPRLPLIFAEALKDKDVDVRKSAVYSLRLVETKEALDLVQAALTDESPTVRKAAVEAFGHQPENLQAYWSALSERLKTESVKEIRQFLLQVLSYGYSKSLVARDAIDRAAKDDKEKEVRDYARNIIDTKTGGRPSLLQ